MQNVNTKNMRKHMSSPIHPPSILEIDIVSKNSSVLDNEVDFKSFLLSTKPCDYYYNQQGNIRYGYTCLKQWVTCVATYCQASKRLQVIDIVSLDEYISKLGTSGTITC